MWIDIHIKFPEDLLNGFQVTEQTHFFVTDKVPGEITQKSKNELWFLHSVGHLMLIDIYMKFLEDILNWFQVTERTQFCDKIPREITKKF